MPPLNCYAECRSGRFSKSITSGHYPFLPPYLTPNEAIGDTPVRSLSSVMPYPVFAPPPLPPGGLRESRYPMKMN